MAQPRAARLPLDLVQGRPQSNLPDDLGPSPEGDGLRAVAPRGGEKEWSTRRAEQASLLQVVAEQYATGRRVRHGPLAPILGRLRSDSQHPVCRVQVVRTQQAELLTAQPGIVGQSKHEPIP